MWEIGFLFIFCGLGFISAEIANPFRNPDVCGKPICAIEDGKFRYGPALQQTYKYSVLVRSLFNGTSKNESTFSFDSRAVLEFLTECEGVVSLRDIKLTEGGTSTSASGEFSSALSRFSLRFSFHDGVISELCPNSEEKVWVLNVKRGLLSMLQNTMERFDLDANTIEEDVKGKCDTKYKVIGSDKTSLVIEKTKDLPSCTRRSKLHSVIQSVPYRFRSKLRPEESILDSSSSCQISIDHNVYKSIECVESHLLKPFSNRGSGVTTVIKQSLLLEKEENSTALVKAVQITKRVSLLFDHTSSGGLVNDDLRNAKNFLTKMCEMDKEDDHILFSDVFTELINSLRMLTDKALSEIYDHSSSLCPTGKKNMLDALPYIGNTAAFTLMKGMIIGGKIRSETMKDWMFSISFTIHPDNKMIMEAAELLEHSAFHPEIVLSVGALTHLFCSENTNCLENSGVMKIVEHLENGITDLLGNNTAARENHEMIVVFLKALGNIGIVTNSFEDKLTETIENANLDMEIRIAAIECHRRRPCDKSREYFEKIYNDQTQDSELRIASYLQIMKCPNYLMIRGIRQTLENEEVNQVGSFVWSHLNNLLKSAVPSRVEIQGLLSDKVLIKKFSSDIRKFSHNYEGSLFFEEYNMGSSYDSNVIFSSKSYIPSSATFNMTVDLFGESINLFEISGRMKGFENYLEALFGPKGPWSYSKLQDKIPKFRFAREIGSELLKSQLRNTPNVMENDFGDPKVSFGVRIFGNDLKYVTYNGYDEMKEAINHLNPMYYLSRLLSSREINYHKAMMFLDSTYAIPTGAGLPMSLSAVGTSSINMKLFGTLKAENFAKTKELEVEADLEPTASFDITSSLSVDAFYVKTGLKVKTSMYSSSALKGYAQVNGYKFVKVNVTIPQQKSEIFNSRSELLVLSHAKEEPQYGLKQYLITRSLCSWPVIEKTLGLKGCTEYHFVNVTKMRHAPYFVLAGPAGFRMFVEKLDPKANTFIFEYKWTERNDKSAISLTFDAPGSNLGRIVGANFTVDKQSQNVTLLIKTTSGNVLAKGKYKNTPDEKYLQVDVIVNDFKHFDTSVSLTRKPISHGYMYYPKFYLGVNNERVVEIQGTVKMMNKKGIFQYDVDLKFQTKRVTSKLFGYVSKTQATLATQLRMMYKFPNTPEQGVDIAFSIANRSKRNLMDIQGSASIESTSYPQYDFESKLNLLRGHAHTEGKLHVTFNHKDDPMRRTNFGLLIVDKSLDDSSKIFNAVVTLTKPSKNIDVNADFKYQSKSPNMNVALIIDYAKDKRFSTTVFIHDNRRPLQDFKLQVNMTLPTFQPMVASFVLHEKYSSHYNVGFNGTWFSGHTLSARGFYQDKSTSRSYDHHAKLLVQSPSFLDVYCNLHYYRDRNELKVDMKFDQNKKDYQILLKHLNSSPEESSTLAKLKYHNKIYSLLTNIYSGDHQRIGVELHFDQMRDIQFAAWAHNKESYKSAGVELKWDANRDPNQKLIVSGNFTKVASFNYLSNILASYPGRTLLGNYEFILRRGHVYNLLRLSWDDEQSFAVIMNSDYNFEKKMYLIGVAEVVTPFDNWKQTFVDVGFEHELNMYSLNGSMKWEKNQHVSLDIFGNYTADDDSLDCKYRSVLSSTLENIPSLSASVAHTKNNDKIDTLLRLQYAPEEIIDIKSKWEIVKNEKSTNYTGTVVASTPYSGFNKGYLISKVMVTKDRYMRGVADLDFDFKKFSISAEGRLKKLTNSMLTVNITTPIEKYSTINGRFGFVEDQRYLVAMITYPSKILGVEVLLSVQSLTEFDTKFILGTPLDVLQRMILVGKLKPETADFRAGWNSLLGGFSGRWHFVCASDFEYKYIVYTPIEDFEESSVILKVDLMKFVDIEASARLSSQKLGVKIFGETKPALLKELDIKLEDIYGSKNGDKSYSKEKEEYDDDDLTNWSGLVEFDTLVYPTIKGTLDLDQKGPIYTVKSKLTLPDGDAIINDRVEYHGVFSMKNKLEVKTPYAGFSDIYSDYEINIVPSHVYIFSLSLNYLKETKLMKNEISAEYLILNGTEYTKVHNMTLHTQNELLTFLNIDSGGSLSIKKKETERNYVGKFYLTRDNIHVETNAEVNLNASTVDADLYLQAKTPSVYVPPVFLKYKRERKNEENSIELHLNVPELYKKQVFVHADWSFQSPKDFNTYLNIQSPFEGFEKSIIGVKATSTPDAQIANIVFDVSPVDAVINNTFKNDMIHSVALFNVSGQSIPVIVKCNVIKMSPISRKLDGIVMIRNKQFNIAGNVDLLERLPTGLHVEIIPQEGKDTITVDYKITTTGDSSYKFVGSAKNSRSFVTLNADADVKKVTDWDANAKMETSNEKYRMFTFKADAREENDRKSLRIEAETPIKKLEKTKIDAYIQNTPESNRLNANFDASTRKGNMDLQWIWLYMENMKIVFDSNLQIDDRKSFVNAKGFYVNPKKEFNYLQVGGNLDWNENWKAGSNLTLVMPSIQNISVDGYVKLPPPRIEMHMVKGKLFYTTPIDRVEYFAKYNTDVSKKNYASNGTAIIMKEGDNNKYEGNLAVEWAPEKGINNIISYSEVENGCDFVYKLSTPKYKAKKAFVINGSHRNSDNYHNVTCHVFKPEHNSVLSGTVNIKEFANMNGLLNVTIPYENMNYAAVKFSTQTSANVFNRYLEAFWPENSAKIEAKCDIKTGETLLHRTRKGSILVEIPIATKHRANVDYIFEESPLRSVGNATVDYNSNRILNGKYNCLTESRAGFEKDTTHVELNNKFLPIGADYIHRYEYGAALGDEITAPSKDSKHLKLFHLTNRTKFAIEGDLSLGTTSTGQQIEIGIKHLNKTVNFQSDYDIMDQEYKQHSRLSLSPKIWIEYNVSLLNQTMDEDFDSQRLQIDVQYPSRNFTAIGSYKIGEESISSDVILQWDTDHKYVEAGLDWKRISEKHEQVLLTLTHPSFEKDVTLLTEYDYDGKKLIDAKMKFEYAEDPDHLFVMGGRLDDNSKDENYNYTYSMYVTHNATSLDFQGNGETFWSPDIFITNHQNDYKRSYLPVQHSEALIRLDFLENEVEMKRDNKGELSYLKSSYKSDHPIYTGKLITTHEFNDANGDFKFDWKNKIFRMDYNMTTDGRQSMHMYGDIPDSRSAKFDSWRDYEDIKITDVTYYLKMNHSRLVVSSLKWRPDLFRVIRAGIHGGLYSIYNYAIDAVNDTRQYVRSEIKEAISGVCNEAEPFLQTYLDDVRGLRIIEEDLEELKIFLNTSYHANDFYIKTLVTVSLYTFDELALKKHFESVPAIISEIWSIMGDSGKKIQKSIEWVIEKVKTYYKNITMFMRQLLDGDPVQHLSNAMSSILEQYDDFIRKMHVAFIKYIEKLWDQTYNLIVDNWYKMLIAIEPTFLKLLAYMESIVWTTSQEFLDFLYIRKSEILESPYFAKFTNFTHDLDIFYKDMSGNNTLSSVVKYSKIGYNFFRTKYMDKLPFAKELEAIIREILGDLNKLRKLPSVAFLEDRFNQMFSRLVWFYEYFEVESRIQNFVGMMHRKMTDYSQTALQAENRFRQAKTKFIFDPNAGEMYWEQKMPMSWHAFNETPNFHEIPEIKAIYDVQDFFVSSHTSFWSFYYDYKPYLDPSEWLPPFKAQAHIIGNQHYITFDKKFYQFKGGCSYLLATDMKDHNFSLVVSYESESPAIILNVNKTFVEIDMFKDSVKIKDSPYSQLPIEIGDLFIHRDSGLITIESAAGFLLECNTVYHVCTFEVSGWYFGKTAGLLGTIDNEPSDDLLSSTKLKHNLTSVAEFANSWTLDQKCTNTPKVKPTLQTTKANEEVFQFCENLYANKVSQYSSCFKRVNKDPFLKMCSESESIDEACSTAAAYSTLCSFENTPLRIPDSCVRCEMPNGSFVNEGDFVRFTGRNISQSADVIFLVETKECNANLTSAKNLRMLVDTLDEELVANSMMHNRYGVVLFGGDGVYNEPKVRSLNGKIFTNYSTVPDNLENLPIGNGSADIFSALIYATKLNFRPAVSKIFILLPCSECHESSMKYDYPILHQLLSENAITLHILMNEGFNLQKAKENKLPYGIDSKRAFTKKDFRLLKGDESLRNHIKLPKTTMGLCVPLALETDGSLFTSKYLLNGKDDTLTKFVSVFTKRVAKNSNSVDCIDCECTAQSSGISYMECSSCLFPSRASIENGFEEDELIMNLQPSEHLFS